MDPRLDVDIRFLLANERTLLAWVRTGLTLMAAGAAVEQFAEEVPGRTGISVALLLVGVVATVLGGRRHAAADRAIRSGVLPASGRAPYLLVATTALVGLVLVVGVLAA